MAIRESDLVLAAAPYEEVNVSAETVDGHNGTSTVARGRLPGCSGTD